MERFKVLWLLVGTCNPILIDSTKNSKDNRNCYIMPNIKFNSWKERSQEPRESELLKKLKS